MKKENYYRWFDRRVRRKSEPAGPVGRVVEPTKIFRWWRVEWPGGKLTIEPERGLVIVPEES